MLIDAQEISLKHDGWPCMTDHPKLAAGLRLLADAVEAKTVTIEALTTYATAKCDNFTVQVLVIKYVEKEQGNEQQG